MSSGRKQRWFESDGAYERRLQREADEGRIERNTGQAPSRSLFESNERYEDRISREADESTIEGSAGSKPSQGWFESNSSYEDRVEKEAREHNIESVKGDAPSQGWFESDEAYEHRIERESNEATVERATGDKPSQGWFESDSTYEDRISREADEHDSDSKSSDGCFLTTACTEFAGLSDDCHELRVLRKFRDSYMISSPHGRQLIAQYYSNAPRIVDCIHRSSQREMVLNLVLSDIRCAVFYIDSGDNMAALHVYMQMYNRLHRQFLRGFSNSAANHPLLPNR